MLKSVNSAYPSLSASVCEFVGVKEGGMEGVKEGEMGKWGEMEGRMDGR